MRTHIRLLLGCFVAVLLVGLYFVSPAKILTRIRLANDIQTHLDGLPLGVMSQIYVVSLPRRTERRQEMERLKKILGLRWSYFPAISNDSSVVHAIMQRVKGFREECGQNKPNCSFSWPDDLGSSVASMRPLDLWSSDFLVPSSIQRLSETWLSEPVHPLTCATKNFSIQKYSAKLPSHLLLTQARVACWHSHLSVIRLISNEELFGPRSSFLILEDDIDMESDIKTQLRNLWSSLPADWDIVFLGHCWSKEANSEPLIGLDGSSRSKLYPSISPKCTHAYALTRMGARRLLLHLQYAPFAYSRAIDQAIAWLIESGRLKAYSVVPSLVAQRKVVESDVMPGKGSKWKDHLTDGVLA